MTASVHNRWQQDAEALFQIGRSGALVLDAIRRKGSVARSELTEATPLSQQSVHRLAEDLLERGLLRLEAPKIAGRGKPSPQLALAPDGAYGIGLAIDTDDVRLAVTNLVGDLMHLTTLEADPNDPEGVRFGAEAEVAAIVAQLGLPAERIAGVGISMQGYRRKPGTAFVPPPKIAAWRDRDVASIFENAFAFPVMAENNATLGAEAENWVGAGRRFDNFAYLSINQGFGGGIVVNGAPYGGYHMNAAEISSIYTEEESERRPALRILIAMLREAGHEIGSVSALKTRYDPSWPTIDRWIERVTPALDQMLRAITGILDPAAIVFGGEAPHDLRRRLAQAANPRTVDDLGLPFPGPELLISEIETDPNVLGAALLPIRSRLFC
ncbi:ROK family protein [Martelella mediterranea]|uniref:ROK family protein n=1 Tax=uncultured Martelella sp. TaxID=392331 RepID=UPI0015E5B152|nr:ROK family protein [uncultured Martelella sp.]